jgi:DNA-binding NarL/FixJ family response regulator
LSHINLTYRRGAVLGAVDAADRLEREALRSGLFLRAQPWNAAQLNAAPMTEALQSAAVIDGGPALPFPLPIPIDTLDALVRSSDTDVDTVADRGAYAALDMVISGDMPVHDLATCRLVVAVPNAHSALADALCEPVRARGYAVNRVTPSTAEQLAGALHQLDARVLLLHTELLETIDLHDLLQLRRRFPATDWVFASHSRSQHLVDLIVRFQARGWIDADDSRNFGRAIDAVIHGDLWFPRWVADAMYVALLAAVRVARIDAAETLDSLAVALTHREAEALELMRQGLTNKEIARRLEVSVNTIKKHLKNAFDKRGLHSRRQGLS